MGGLTGRGDRCSEHSNLLRIEPASVEKAETQVAGKTVGRFNTRKDSREGIITGTLKGWLAEPVDWSLVYLEIKYGEREALRNFSELSVKCRDVLPSGGVYWIVRWEKQASSLCRVEVTVERLRMQISSLCRCNS